MTVFDILTLICGLCLFLYGMNVMGESLKKSAGNKLKIILGRMTSNPLKGFMLGLAVTAAVQSSSATTVMVVGFVNSGLMTLRQSVSVTMGANLGAAATAWLTGLSGLGSGGESVSSALQWLKPSSWMPLLALIGIALLMFCKKSKKKDIAPILLGFSVLMVGMEIMSGSVEVLQTNESFKKLLISFENPFLGVLVGLVFTLIIQSSSASVGILQSLTMTGAVTFGTAFPIIIGLNIGTCITAIISSMQANKNGKRAALVHLYFNVLGGAIWLAVYCVTNSIFDFSFTSKIMNMWDIAAIHTIFKLLCCISLAPLGRVIEKLAYISIRDSKHENVSILDERFFASPAVAVDRADTAAHQMSLFSSEAIKLAIKQILVCDEKQCDSVREYEDKVDELEDSLGTYLVKLSSMNVTRSNSREITKLLHLIGDLERISDHAVNLVESAEEMRDKELTFSDEAKTELTVLINAVNEILSLSHEAFVNNDLEKAYRVEPLEQVVDLLKDEIKRNHILRLQKSECTIEMGFVLNDILTNLERVADHCSNIAGCIIEISRFDELSMHKYLGKVKKGESRFEQLYSEYKEKYAL